ncbi:1-(5-phosphoribosyl)-5-((5-phosphoribosylamino)methylideneamino)imidazole-4-carboxamide isomerase [Chromatiales bacterium (ex Bugula neritina AB1)]|nr:1-(5-phosphoribosyl)-5-((5-phosphoribosylamino)methylideneamino)imidazole-4-carboxamide isomerase [Chromatiales bacterium (ex Bugula neritina AB1)]
MTRPTELKLHQRSRVLEIHFDDGFECNLTCEYLRVHSPSAEVQGHGPGQEVLQVGKEDVGIDQLIPSGNYAVKIVFDDGHDSGIFTWSYLHGLGVNFEHNWQVYLDKLAAKGLERNTKFDSSKQ